MTTITFSVQTPLKSDPYTATYNMEDSDVVRVLNSYSKIYGQVIDVPEHVDPNTNEIIPATYRDRTTSEALLTLVENMIHDVMFKVAESERTTAIEVARQIQPSKLVLVNNS